MKEADIMRRYQIDASIAGNRLFRNNVGRGVVGKEIRTSKPKMMLVNTGDVLVRHARPFHAGLCVGSGDLIGWTRKVITAEMIGETVAIFTSEEIKTETGKASEAQENWRKTVISAGGYAAVRKG